VSPTWIARRMSQVPRDILGHVCHQGLGYSVYYRDLRNVAWGQGWCFSVSGTVS
jgi:hypothetical protein